mgnify:FL=1
MNVNAGKVVKIVGEVLVYVAEEIMKNQKEETK